MRKQQEMKEFLIRIIFSAEVNFQLTNNTKLLYLTNRAHMKFENFKNSLTTSQGVVELELNLNSVYHRPLFFYTYIFKL